MIGDCEEEEAVSEGVVAVRSDEGKGGTHRLTLRQCFCGREWVASSYDTPWARRGNAILDLGDKVPTRSWGSTAASGGFIYYRSTGI